jgi:hypothetical protein
VLWPDSIWTVAQGSVFSWIISWMKVMLNNILLVVIELMLSRTIVHVREYEIATRVAM